MTAEQLEELASGRDPSFMGMDCEEAIKALARRVIAAEKLVEAAQSVLERGYVSAVIAEEKEDHDALQSALTAYREASKGETPQ